MDFVRRRARARQPASPDGRTLGLGALGPEVALLVWTGRTLRVGPSAARILRIPRSAVCGRPLRDGSSAASAYAPESCLAFPVPARSPAPQSRRALRHPAAKLPKPAPPPGWKPGEESRDRDVFGEGAPGANLVQQLRLSSPGRWSGEDICCCSPTALRASAARHRRAGGTSTASTARWIWAAASRDVAGRVDVEVLGRTDEGSGPSSRSGAPAPPRYLRSPDGRCRVLKDVEVQPPCYTWTMMRADRRGVSAPRRCHRRRATQSNAVAPTNGGDDRHPASSGRRRGLEEQQHPQQAVTKEE